MKTHSRTNWKRKLIALVSTLALSAAVVFPASAMDATGTIIFDSTQDPGAYYERIVKMDNGNLLAVFDQTFPWYGSESETPTFYTSSDGGNTWSVRSTLNTEADGIDHTKIGMAELYVLPQQVGNFPKGTILYACSNWDTDYTYTINIWRSTDNGLTWTHHSDLAPRTSRNTWEPEFSVSSDGKLVCYYSDERQQGYDQCLVEEISTDGGLTWGNFTIIVGKYVEDFVPFVSPAEWRPGMPRVQKLLNGTYMLVWENINVDRIEPEGTDYPVDILTCKISSDGINWGDPENLGTPIIAGDDWAAASPKIALIDDGSTYGRLFVRGMNDQRSPSKCFTSTDNGETWSTIDSPITDTCNPKKGASWSGDYLVDGNKLYEIINTYDGSRNHVHVGTGVLYGNQLVVSGADYRLKNVGSGYCLDDPGGSMTGGTQMIQWRQNDLDTQAWHLTNTNGDYYKLTCNFSGLNLDNNQNLTTPGNPVIQWEDNGNDAQKWKLVYMNNGNFKLQNLGGGLYLDTENQSTAEHANIVQNTGNNSLTQQWKLERIYQVARFQSVNYPDNWIWHKPDNSCIAGSRFTDLAQVASEWKVVEGLADSSCISLESVDKPGWYLRHQNGNVIISQNDGSDLFKSDATWREKPGLSDSSKTSLETYAFEGIYMRHYEGNMIISSISTDLDRADATFLKILQ